MGLVQMLDASTPSVMSLSDYLSTLGTVISKMIEWVVQVLTTITSNPILLVPFGVVATFTAIKILKKIF